MDNIKRFLSKPKNVLIVYSVFGFGVLVILIVGVVLIAKRPSAPQDNSTRKDDEKVLSNILKNNTQSLFPKSDVPQAPVIPTPGNGSPTGSPAQNSGSQPTNPTTQPGNLGVADLPDPKAVPDINVYNYRHTKISYSQGPAAQVCTTLFRGYGDGPTGMISRKIGSTETYEYFERFHSYYKSTSNDTDSDLISHTITKYGNDVNTYYVYEGGSYAALEKFSPYPGFDNNSDYISYPVSSPQSTQTYLTNYFGSNAKLLGKVTDNYKEYYIIESQYQTYCGDTNPYLYVPGVEPAKLVNIINRMKVDAVTFQIIQEQTYLESVSSQNLISTMVTFTETKKVDFNQVSSVFNSDYNVSTRTVDYTHVPPYSPYGRANEFLNYLNTAHEKILLPLEYNTISYFDSPKVVYGAVPGSDFYQDRNFYPAGAKGDSIYQQNIDWTSNRAEFSAYINYGGSISVYSEGKTLDELLTKAEKYQSTLTNLNDTVVTIDGVDYPAKILTKSYIYFYPNSGVSMPVSSYVSYPSSYPSYSYATTQIFFEYNGRVYELSDDANTNLKSYDTDNANDTGFLYNLILNNLVNSYYGNGNPTSYPASFPSSFPAPGSFV